MKKNQLLNEIDLAIEQAHDSAIGAGDQIPMNKIKDADPWKYFRLYEIWTSLGFYAVGAQNHIVDPASLTPQQIAEYFKHEARQDQKHLGVFYLLLAKRYLTDSDLTTNEFIRGMLKSMLPL